LISFVNNLFYDTSTSNNASPVIENWEAFADSVVVQDNSFLNVDRVALALKENYTSAQIQAQGNWFDSIDVNAISARVHDVNDSSNYASIIDTSAYLSSAATNTPTLNGAIVKIDSNTYLHNTTINYYSNNADTAISTLVNTGDIEIAQSMTFDEVKLSATDAYTPDIGIQDAIAVLRDIVNLSDLTGHAFHAGDVDNNNKIDIQDAIGILRDIVNIEKIDTFDLIDANNDRVTQLDANVTDTVPTWTLVANGDVDMGGEFDAAYMVTINKPPVLSTPTQASITEDASPNTVTGSLVASDPESDTLSYAVVGETAANNIYTVTGTYGTLTLDSTDGSYSYDLNNALSTVQALGASDSVTESFNVQVSDSISTTTAQALSFSITGVNDAPSLSVSNLTSIDENASQAVAASVSATDTEDGSIAVVLSGSGVDDVKF
jgi:VCBS repeat-containing protein